MVAPPSWGIVGVMRQSGCEVPGWMLRLKQRSKKAQLVLPQAMGYPKNQLILQHLMPWKNPAGKENMNRSCGRYGLYMLPHVVAEKQDKDWAHNNSPELMFGWFICFALGLAGEAHGRVVSWHESGSWSGKICMFRWYWLQYVAVLTQQKGTRDFIHDGYPCFVFFPMFWGCNEL